MGCYISHQEGVPTKSLFMLSNVSFNCVCVCTGRHRHPFHSYLHRQRWRSYRALPQGVEGGGEGGVMCVSEYVCVRVRCCQVEG